MSEIDVSTLKVGDRLPSLTVEPISRATLALFAGASGDHNPIHIDSDFAKASGMGDVFAHGMLSMGYLSRVLVAFLPQACLRDFRVRFRSITPVHARPTCEGQVSSVEQSETETVITVDLDVRLADGTQTLAGTAIFAVPTQSSTG